MLRTNKLHTTHGTVHEYVHLLVYIKYKCSTRSTVENKNTRHYMKLKCDTNTKIVVLKASYGRTHSNEEV